MLSAGDVVGDPCDDHVHTHVDVLSLDVRDIGKARKGGAWSSRIYDST